jgi:hypothetical protein
VTVTSGLHVTPVQLVAAGLLAAGLAVVFISKLAGRLVVIAAAVVELVTRAWPHGWHWH